MDILNKLESSVTLPEVTEAQLRVLVAVEDYCASIVLAKRVGITSQVVRRHLVHLCKKKLVRKIRGMKGDGHKFYWLRTPLCEDLVVLNVRNGTCPEAY